MSIRQYVGISSSGVVVYIGCHNMAASYAQTRKTRKRVLTTSSGLLMAPVASSNQAIQKVLLGDNTGFGFTTKGAGGRARTPARTRASQAIQGQKSRSRGGHCPHGLKNSGCFFLVAAVSAH